MSATLSVEAGRTPPLPLRPTSGAVVFVIATSVSVQSSMQVDYPNCPSQGDLRSCLFNDLKQPVEHSRVPASSIWESLPALKFVSIYSTPFCAMPRD